MSEQVEETLVTPDMIERKEVWGRERQAPPISESDIRKWAIATYWPEKPPQIYWDADYAKGTAYEGIIAPPDFSIQNCCKTRDKLRFPMRPIFRAIRPRPPFLPPKPLPAGASFRR